YNLGGNAPLPTFATNPKGRVWAEARLRQFGLNYQNAGSKVAFINLIPYRSSEGSKDKKRMIPHLASSRIVLAWACDTLFREAESGKRVVVCLRSAKDWGLDPAIPERGLLFTPKVNPRSGYLVHGAVREKVCLAVRRAVFGLA